MNIPSPEYPLGIFEGCCDYTSNQPRINRGRVWRYSWYIHGIFLIYHEYPQGIFEAMSGGSGEWGTACGIETLIQSASGEKPLGLFMPGTSLTERKLRYISSPPPVSARFPASPSPSRRCPFYTAPAFLFCKHLAFGLPVVFLCFATVVSGVT